MTMSMLHLHFISRLLAQMKTLLQCIYNKDDEVEEGKKHTPLLNKMKRCRSFVITITH